MAHKKQRLMASSAASFWRAGTGTSARYGRRIPFASRATKGMVIQMATRQKRKKQRGQAGRVLVVLLFAAAALFAVYKCVVRPMELPPDDESLLPVGASTQEGSAADPTPTVTRKENFFNILVCGVDDGNGGSDTNILVGFDAGTGVTNCVSIPRDTRAVIHGKAQKINAAYNIGGVELLAETVEDLLGVPVDFTVKVDLKGFVELVDAIGGVDFTVPINMNYDDPLQNLSIHFNKGMQHLTGAQALRVVRFRHNNDGTGYGSEDIGRMGTQQAFLKTVAQKMLQPSNLDKIPAFAKIFQKYVETDLTLGNLAWMGEESLKMGTTNINFFTLPGEWKSPFIYPSQQETLDLVNSCLNPYDKPLTLADMDLG